MINKLREELIEKCNQIDNKMTETRIKFETSITEMQLQKNYLKSLIFNIDEYHDDLVENVENNVEIKQDIMPNLVCANCDHLSTSVNTSCRYCNNINNNTDINNTTCSDFKLK